MNEHSTPEQLEVWRVEAALLGTYHSVCESLELPHQGFHNTLCGRVVPYEFTLLNLAAQNITTCSQCEAKWMKDSATNLLDGLFKDAGTE